MAVKTKKSISQRTAASKQMEPSKVAQVRAKLKLPRNKFSRLLGFSERAVAGWEAGQRVRGVAQRRVVEIDRLRHELAQIVKEEAIADWLDTPNEAFDGLKPLEVIERGEGDRLWRMVFYLKAGVAS